MKQSDSSIKPSGAGSTALAMFLCWLAYTMAYLGRYSYASNITSVMDAFQVSHSEAGLVTTCFFFAYGAGQVISGLLCHRYSQRWMIPLALLSSAALNFAVFAGAPFAWFSALWLLNGLVQSVLWSTLIHILSVHLPSTDLKKAVIVLSTTVPVGTLLTYGISSAFAAFGSYRGSFLVGAVVMALAAMTWLALFGRAFAQPQGQTEAPVSRARRRLDTPLLRLIVLLCLMAVANNLVKDGLTTWIPSILRERFGLQASLSILLSVILPMMGLLGAACNTSLNRRITSFLSLGGFWYLVTTLCLVGVIALLRTSLWLGVLLLFGCIALCMHAVNNLITSMAPLYLRDRMESGLLAGVLNGCCYVGSTISSYGLGVVADAAGWDGVFRLLLAVCAVATALSCFTFLEKRSTSGVQ